ncbi:MAG: response regulator [Desulfuromonadales bacterium]|nr:MAG: response regulator [Desulfuromonadales bacterium]
MQPSDASSLPLSVLYVEDDATARQIACRIISMKFPGLVVHMAGNGREGLEAFTAHQPDIVITDITMPEMDGIRMAGAIREIDASARIIVVTAYSDSQYLMEAINMGISQYVLKPIDRTKLCAAIETCLGGILLERRVRAQNAHIRKLSLAVEQSPSMVMITDADGTIEYVNPKFTEITGYSAEEVINRNPRMMQSGYTAPEVYENLWKTIAGGGDWHGEILNRKKNGDLYWESSSISSISGENGEISHYVAVKEDISDRKEAEQEIALLTANLAARAQELEEVNQELEEANKELEAFNYTVSHDLRTPLTTISGYTQLLLETHAERLGDDCAGYLGEIGKSTRRMNRLIDDLLEFSRSSRQELHRETVDLSALAREIVLELTVGDPHRRAEFSLADGVTCHGDRGLMEVVMQNLLGNAWKYTGKNDVAVIEFGITDTEGQPEYYVRDNGIGFDSSQAHRLFGTFQRLHPAGEFEGTGIGLATVHRIIKRHGGSIRAEGEPGKGAAFFFTL